MSNPTPTPAPPPPPPPTATAPVGNGSATGGVGGTGLPTVSLELRGATGGIIMSAPQGLRGWIFAGAAVASGLIYLLRKGYTDGVRRRVIRRLDVIAPRVRFCQAMIDNGTLFNTDCPVCLCEFSKRDQSANDDDEQQQQQQNPRRRQKYENDNKIIRILDCGHALCAGCLEAWAVHCTKAHLNPSRFGITRNGRVVAWTPGPKCPLCCARLNCVPKEDWREAVIAAIGHRGVALSTYVALSHDQNRPAQTNQYQSSASSARTPSSDRQSQMQHHHHTADIDTDVEVNVDSNSEHESVSEAGSDSSDTVTGTGTGTRLGSPNFVQPTRTAW